MQRLEGLGFSACARALVADASSLLCSHPPLYASARNRVARHTAGFLGGAAIPEYSEREGAGVSGQQAKGKDINSPLLVTLTHCTKCNRVCDAFAWNSTSTSSQLGNFLSHGRVKGMSFESPAFVSASGSSETMSAASRGLAEGPAKTGLLCWSCRARAADLKRQRDKSQTTTLRVPKSPPLAGMQQLSLAPRGTLTTSPLLRPVLPASLESSPVLGPTQSPSLQPLASVVPRLVFASETRLPFVPIDSSVIQLYGSSPCIAGLDGGPGSTQLSPERLSHRLKRLRSDSFSGVTGDRLLRQRRRAAALGRDSKTMDDLFQDTFSLDSSKSVSTIVGLRTRKHAGGALRRTKSLDPSSGASSRGDSGPKLQRMPSM